MKQTLPILALSLLPLAAPAQTLPEPADSATFLLHKFEQRIGKETYRLTRTAQQHRYDVDFRFVDRGSPVPLRARLVTTPGGEPLELVARGKTSRFSTIHDSVRLAPDGSGHARVDKDVRQVEASETPRFPVAGYSPATGQWLLLRYWLQHGRPQELALLPSGTVRIREDGHDTLTFQNQPLILTRYVLKGLVWGNELLWTDPQGRLACIITNDAEGDKIEMLRQPYAALLPELIARAASHGMRPYPAAARLPAERRQRPLELLMQTDRMAIVGGTVLDVVRGVSLPNATVLLENGRISKVGPANKVKVPKNTLIIRAEGQTVLPGLWDMHAHFQQAEWGPAYLAAGVTTVRDCGNEFSYINAIEQAINSGQGIGPRILKAGIVDGSGKRPLGIIRADSPAEAAAVVQRYKAAGFRQIKLYSSLKPEVVQALCQEAHRQGLTVTGHIPDGMTAIQGINAGMDQINHLPYVAQLLRQNPTDKSYLTNDTTAARVIRLLVQHRTIVDPTLGVYELTARSTQDDITALEPDFNRLPQALRVLFLTMGTTPERAAAAKPVLQSFGRLTKRLHDAGVPIVAGTDMGFPGSSLARELELYVQAGLSPMQALQAATIVPARVMQLEAQTGSLDPGKQADVLILNGNPLQRISDLRRVRLVIKNGQMYEPARMRELADFGK